MSGYGLEGYEGTGEPTQPIPLEKGAKYYIVVRGSVNFGKWWKNGKTLVNDACYEYSAKGYLDPLSVFQNNLNIIVCDNRYHIDHVYCSGHFVSTGQPIYFWVFDTDPRGNVGDMLVEIFKVTRAQSEAAPMVPVAPSPSAQCKPGDKELVQILTGSAGIGARDPKFIMSGASGGQAFGLAPYDGGSPEIRWAVPPAGAWIGPINGIQYPNSPPAGTYAYRFTFFLENPEGCYLSGQWGSDNQMVVRLNGRVITNAENASEFRSLRSFSVSDSSLFRAGINELRFEVNNEGSAIYPDKSSTGLYVNASVCESKSQEPEAVPMVPVAPSPSAQCKPGDKELVQILTGSAGIGARDPKFIMSGASGGQAFGLAPYDGGSPEIRWAVPPAGAWIGPSKWESVSKQPTGWNLCL